MKIKNELLQTGMIIRTLTGDFEIRSIRQRGNTTEETEDREERIKRSRNRPFVAIGKYLNGQYEGIDNLTVTLPFSGESQLTSKAIIMIEDNISKNIIQLITEKRKIKGLTVSCQFSGAWITIGFGFGTEGIDALKFFHLHFKKRLVVGSYKEEEVVEITGLHPTETDDDGFKAILTAGIIANDLVDPESRLLWLRDKNRPSLERLRTTIKSDIQNTIE